jgi:DNA-binding winged helix-turn-helix (wHTH) protein/TolB-like protein/Tfp pilus assembly protein PilF
MPTYTELMRGFEFGPWQVIPERGLLRDGEDEHHIEPLVMDVFVVLASHGGEVVTKDQLIAEVWDGRPQTDDVITRCISALRKGLGDDAKNPRFIETVQRRGYRVILPVSQPEQEPVMPVAEAPSVKPDVWVIAVGFLAVAAIAWYALMRDGPGSIDPTGATTIAVYPFECLQAANEANEHLCFGFAEEAISNLKQVEGLRIVRKRKSYDSTLFSDEERIVTGSVQIIGDQVKVAARLEDTSSDVVDWSDTYDAGRSGIFDLQRRFANGLRAHLDPDFSGDDVTIDEPATFAAEDAYDRGRYLFEKRDSDTIEETIAAFREAIRLDPTFGPAWLNLAYTYSIWPDYDLTIDREATFDQALEIMAQGIEADPSIENAAGTVYGYIAHKRNEWDEAMAQTLRAVEADSPGADDYHWHSRVLASVGRLGESLHFARLGAQLDPDNPVIMSRLAIAYFWVNDLENAARYFKVANEMELDAPIHSLAYSLYLIRTGEFGEARARIKRALEEFNLDTSWVDPIIDGVEYPALRDQAIGMLGQLQNTGQMPDNVIMTLSVLLEDIDRAMAVARGLASGDSVFEIEIIYVDEFRDFRRHEQFGEFVEMVGLQDYWDGAGCAWIEDRVVCPETANAD